MNERIFELSEHIYGCPAKNTPPLYYPEIKTSVIQRGFFPSLQMAEKELKDEIGTRINCGDYNNREDVDTYSFVIREYNSCTLLWTACPMLLSEDEFITEYTYLPSGKKVDTCEAKDWSLSGATGSDLYRGRTPRQIRFRPGDLVERWDVMYNTVSLGIVVGLPLSVEEVKQRQEEKPDTIFDRKADRYAVLLWLNGEISSQDHKEYATRIFPPRYPVSDKLKNKLQEAALHYEHTN
jgi:hypothetical protein